MPSSRPRSTTCCCRSSRDVGSEQAYAKLTESLQTFGGSGFLQDYPVEQYIRDAKIDSLYEGTTAIQAQDFFFRKIIRDKGVALGHVAGQIGEFIKNESGNGRLKTERELLAKALEDVQAMAASMTGDLMAAQENSASIYKVGLASVRFLMSVGDLVIGWLLQRQAAVAIEALDAGASRRRPFLLRGQDRRRLVLRQEHAAAADQHASGDRDDRQRDHGARRSGVLDPRSLRPARRFQTRPSRATAPDPLGLGAVRVRFGLKCRDGRRLGLTRSDPSAALDSPAAAGGLAAAMTLATPECFADNGFVPTSWQPRSMFGTSTESMPSTIFSGYPTAATAL